MHPDYIKVLLGFIAEGGTGDGAHHKQWYLDLLARTICPDDAAYQEWRKQFLVQDGDQVVDTWDTGKRA